MAFNPNFINTHLPPPNYSPVPMQFPAHQTNPCPTPPISQQHMFNTGMHVPPPSPSPSFFNTNPPNYLPSPSPPVAMGSVHNPITTPPPMWNNNVMNTSMVNRQNHHVPITLPVVDTRATSSFQAPPPTPGMQFKPPNLNNSVNLPNNYTGLLAIAPNVSSGYNQQNINDHAPVGLNFQSPIPQFNGNCSTENVSVWSNDKFPSNETFKPPPPVNQNRFNVNKHPNAFLHNNGRNSIQKTNVPDSSIFQNPSAIFNGTANNGPLHAPVIEVSQSNFQNNAAKMLPTARSDMIPNQAEENNIYHENGVSFQNSATNYSKYPPKPSNFHNSSEVSNQLRPPLNAVMQSNFQNNAAKMLPTAGSDMILLNQAHGNRVSFNNSATNYPKYPPKPNNFHHSSDRSNQFKKRYYENRIKDNNIHSNNFRETKSKFSEGQNLSYQHNNQNLIDIKVLPNQDAFEEKISNNKFLDSKNHCNSSSTSSVIEEYTISDSESVNSRNSPQKYQRNKKIFENLQTVNSESNRNNFQNNTGWMTESIQKALQKRNMLFKQARATNDPAVWDEYNRLKNEINEEIRQAKFNSKKNKPRNPPKMCPDKGKKLPFNCDTCDRGFPSKDELNLHMDLHIKCHYSGCNFEAHPKIVSLHQRMQHDTGYADVINKLQNDEEIKKWREERRRRFPTAENILKKKAEQAEKEARGEVIEEKHYGRFRRPRFDERNKGGLPNRQTRNNRFNRKRRHRNAFQRAPEIDLAQESDSDDEAECLTKLPKFQGIKKGSEILPDSNYSKIENAAHLRIEEADNNEVPVHASKDSSNQTDTLSNHLDMAELNDDDDDGPPLEIPIQKVYINEFSDSADENENKLSRKDDHLAEEKISPTSAVNMDEKSNNNVTSSLPAKNDKGNKRERNEKRCRPPIPPRQRNSLLQILLSDEIRHERNVIMQCVRHIVRNNFFGIETNA